MSSPNQSEVFNLFSQNYSSYRKMVIIIVLGHIKRV